MITNKFYYFLLSAFFATLMFSGCQKDSVVLNIEMGNFSSSSKVYVDGYTSYWSDGDNLVINDDEVCLTENGRSVRVAVPSAAMYKAIFPAEYVGEDMQHLNIPNMQPYVTDSAGHQLVKFPMGAYSDNGTTLHFTPMSSLLAIQISNTTGHGTMVVDRVSVSASHAALWGKGTIHNFTSDNRSYTIDTGYISGWNDCIVLSGENGQGMNLSVGQNETKTVYVSIPPIPEEVSNRFTVTVHAYQVGDIPLSYSYSLTQQNEYGGNISGGKLAYVPFTMAESNETAESGDLLLRYSTNNNSNLQSQIASIASANGVSVVGIAEDAFGGYMAMFSGPITQIEDKAFSQCNGLTSIDIPSGVTSIGVNAFSGCSNLESVNIPTTVTTIGSGAFSYCSGLENMSIPLGVTEIASYAFNYCYSLTRISIPTSVTTIGDEAFSCCASLDSVVIPASVTNLGRSAFSYSGITSVSVPSNVTSISDGLFRGCSNLTTVSIASGPTSIGLRSFCDCSSLTSINIPASVMSIGEYAFYNCSSLSSVNIAVGDTCIGACAFSKCTCLTSISIPSSMDSIATSAFSYCTSLSSVTIAQGLSYIGDSAFRNCTSLTSINIPSGVTTIGKYAFVRNTSLASISLPSTLKLISLGTFKNCTGLTNMTIASGISSIGDSAFCGCSSLANAVIPSGVTSIGKSAFNNCTALASVSIPYTVTTIYERAFLYCGNLMSVTCLATTPPTLSGSYQFTSNPSTHVLHVPTGCISAYTGVSTWKSAFKNIIDDAGSSSS